MWEPFGQHEEAGLGSASCASQGKVTGLCFHKAGTQFQPPSPPSSRPESSLGFPFSTSSMYTFRLQGQNACY